MKKFELTEVQVIVILIFFILFILIMGIITGVGMEKLAKCDYFYVSKYQTRGEYLHLPNGTLWKKVKEVNK